MELVEMKTVLQQKGGKQGRRLVEIGSSLPDVAEPHKLTIDEVFVAYGTSPESGLTNDDISVRLAHYGPNSLKPSKDKPIWLKYFIELFSGFGLLLFISTIITFLTYKPLGEPNPQIYNLALSLVLFTVMILQGSFNFYQEYQASNVLKSFKNMLPLQSQVIRSQVQQLVSASQLTVGDVVLVSAGSKVPADLRIIDSKNLKVDNSALTGESEPVRCMSGPCDCAILESRNMLFLGTSVVEGSGVAVVVTVGDRCEMGRIVGVAANTTHRTPLNLEILRVVYIITFLAILTGTTVTLGWNFWLKVDHPDYMTTSSAVMNVIGVLVVYIPEGLPIAVTVGLALIAKRLCKEYNVMVTRLGTVETLGCVSLIASDKTGTLTQNKMTITGMIVGGVVHSIQDGCQLTLGAKCLLRSGVLCNASKIVQNGQKQEIIGGNGVDVALMQCALRSGLGPVHILECYYNLAEVPFSSTTKYALTINCPATDSVLDDGIGNIKGGHFITMKGAPERVIEKCSHFMDNDGNIVEMTQEIYQNITKSAAEFGETGHRMIAIAMLDLDPEIFSPSYEYDTEEFNFPTSEMVLLGVVAISDPPRKEVNGALRECKSAKVRVVMVTGDHHTTAVAIGRQVGIITHDQVDKFENFIPDNNFRKFNYRNEYLRQSLVITGEDLRKFTQETWDWALKYEEIVFARTTPEHKLAIVTECQKRGHTVAVTGDGANDAPALKKADVGVAMHSGADIARDSADIILLTDNFTALVTGIREGRLVFMNLQKLISYLLPAGNFSELIPVIANVFFGMPLPLSTFLMITICVCTDLFGSLVIIYEEPEADIMEHGPRNSHTDYLLSFRVLIHACLFIGVLETISAFTMYFLFWSHNGLSPDQLIFAWDFSNSDGYAGHTADELIDLTNQSQSVFFVTLVVCQLGNLLSARKYTPYSIDMGSRLKKFWNNPKQFKRFAKFYSFAFLAEIFWALIFTEIPFFHYYLSTAHVPFQYWLSAVGFSCAIFACEELRKLVIYSTTKK